MKILVPTSELVNMRFTFYYMQANRIRSDTHKRYWISVYSKKHIQLPPRVEQEAIVGKIEELLTSLNNGISNLKLAQKQLKIYRQAVLKKAFEGEFTKEWRGVNNLISNWTECTFEGLTSSLKRGPFGGDLKKVFFVESGYAVYEQQHAINNDFSSIRYFINNERFNKLEACNAGPGDYIVSCSGTMGKIARLPSDVPIGVINQALMRVRLNEDIVRHDYFLEFFRSTLFQRKILKDSRGSGMQNMAGIKEIKPIKIKLPPLEEQKQIVQEIESRLSSYDKVEQSIKESLEKSEALRQSILKKAFDGDLLSELEVEQCKQEKDYEPANVLLERIKSEKIAKEKTDKKAKIKKKTKK
jgi:type I restriction enzyme S subunit